jgi:hypothetical protein
VRPHVCYRGEEATSVALTLRRKASKLFGIDSSFASAWQTFSVTLNRSSSFAVASSTNRSASPAIVRSPGTPRP